VWVQPVDLTAACPHLLQVSPPLVAFRETVQSAAEAPEGSAVKAAKVVEVTTPSGCCVVRVRTCALPAGVAAALDDHANVLRSRAQGSRARHSSSGSAATNGAAAIGASSSSGADNAAGVTALRSKLESVCADSGAGSKALTQLRKAWLLGPKQIGPNVLLVADGTGDDLFDVPASLVVKTLKSQLKGGISTAAAAATAVAAAGSGSDAMAAAAAAAAEASGGDAGADSSAHLDVHLGRPQGAALMGLVSEQQLAQHSVPSSKQELPGLQHVMGSIESGLVSAFQMATAAGPLCDEPMWGVAFEVCIRVSYTPDDSAAQGAAAAGAPRPEQLALQEDVYGPFSGQVMTAVAGACRRAVMESDPRLVEAMYLCQVRLAGRLGCGWCTADAAVPADSMACACFCCPFVGVLPHCCPRHQVPATSDPAKQIQAHLKPD
jgi:ribosome assembly protein 1